MSSVETISFNDFFFAYLTLKIFLLWLCLVYVCLSMCVYVHMSQGALGGQKSKILPRIGVTGGYKLLDTGAENWIWVPWKNSKCL